MKKWIAALLLVLAALWWGTREREVEPQARVESPAPPVEHRTIEAPVARTMETTAESTTAAPDQIHGALAETLRAKGRDPSERDLLRMTRALNRMMAARDKMRALRHRPEEGGELRRLRDELGEAVAEVESIAGMPLSELTDEGGISAPDDDAPVVFEVMEP